MRIEPTPGRSVWYRPGDEDTILSTEGQPLAATVAAVLPGGKVNLSVLDYNGRVNSRCGVTLVQEGEDPPANGKSYCEWMPYQIGQAKKHAEPAAETAVTSDELTETPPEGDQAVPEDVPVADDLSKHRRGRRHN